jgi:hypothetical protein
VSTNLDIMASIPDAICLLSIIVLLSLSLFVRYLEPRLRPRSFFAERVMDLLTDFAGEKKRKPALSTMYACESDQAQSILSNVTLPQDFLE